MQAAPEINKNNNCENVLKFKPKGLNISRNLNRRTFALLYMKRFIKHSK